MPRPDTGAWAERAWGGKHWDPCFLYPQPARDLAGEVFILRHGHTRSTWVNTAFDLETGFIQYAYVIPDAQVVVIDIHLTERDASTTDVSVLYRRTALSPGHNDHVEELGRQDARNGPEWSSAIEACLRAPGHGPAC